MAGSKTYVYCNVLPSGYKSPYLYITDFEVKPGDIVIIPLRDREKVGLVIDVNTYSDDNAPYPPEQTKYISRFFKDEETSLFQTQKIWLDGEKVIRQKINDSFQKQTTKFSLLCNGVEKEKMRKSYRYYIDLLKNVGESNKITTALIKNFNCGVELSDDGKTVTGFIVDKNNKTRLPYVRIPYGVEKICSEAIYDRKIDLMFTPDEFKDDEIYREDSVKRIFTEYGNNYKEIKKNITGLPEIAYLRETSMNNRAEVIEKSLIGEEVYFVEAVDEYDPFRLEVFSELGSLGYLDSYISETIMPLMESKRLDYTARIAELVKLSERNKHAKSSIVGISIDAKMSDIPVHPKTSVPHIER